jgi:aromatic ring-cleaving dioxygenase
MLIAKISEIDSYHAHIYFRDPIERDTAMRLRAEISERFSVQMGRVHDLQIGPHDAPMYQVAFDCEVLPKLIPWLMLNRDGLVILIHPNTANPRRDHLVNSFWMGAVLPIIRPEQLPESIGNHARDVITPNTLSTIDP